MLIVIDFAHIVINFTALRSRNVGRRIVTLVHMLFKEWIHLAEEVLSVKGSLHIVLFNENILCCGAQFTSNKSIIIRESATEFN